MLDNNNDLPLMDDLLSQEVQANQAIGNRLALPKDDNCTRIHLQNINGTNTQEHGDWKSNCELWREMEVDVALVCEHKLDTRQGHVLNALYKGAQSVFGMGTFTLKAATTEGNTAYSRKPGGVLGMIMGPAKGRFLESIEDELGRWICIKLQRKNLPALSIICPYQVVDVNPENTGETTYAASLHASYLRQHRHQPANLRKHHSNDLVEFVEKCQQKGEAVIIAGDLNETIGEELGGMTRLCGECGLIDPVVQCHGAATFSTYNRGSRVN